MDDVTRQAGRRLLDEVEAEMQRVGLWQDGPLDPAVLGFRQPFGADTMTFPQWLQFVFLPRARAVLEGEELLPTDSALGARAVREFDGQDELRGLAWQLTGVDVWLRAALRSAAAPASGAGSALSTEVFETLQRLGTDPVSGVDLSEPASEEALERLQADARGQLGEEIPAAFLALLRITNGLQVNNAYFKKAEVLVLENLDVPRPQVIVLGDQGNVEEYVFDRRDRRFHMINMGFPDERFESFDTFEELLLTVMTHQQVLA